ncbi:aldehyde dehydrogenase family protein [Rhodococcus koreensis]|uniref:aldehyde dehydrogenase family protein n=1 Tax=Rhodococcus koreensis TaxID=99653 RepID=UPI00366BED8F
MTSLLDNPTISVLPAAREFIQSKHQLFIGNEFVDAADGATFETFDPATGSVLTTVASGGAVDVDRAVASASAALPDWARTNNRVKAALMMRLADLIDENLELIAQIDSVDVGKPIATVRFGDVPMASDTLRYYAGWANKIEGSTITPGFPGAYVYTRREPVGVVGAIVPWNFPITGAIWKIAPALATGCTVVLKPAEQSSLSAALLARLIAEAGFPPGVVNVVSGLGTVAGVALVEHKNVAKISFTGSTAVGIDISRRAAETLKSVSLELGGKCPNIIFADADIPAAAAVAASAIFFNAGQACSAGSRLMVERSVYDEVLDAVSAEADKLVLGPGLDEGTTLGPLVSASQQARVNGYVERALAQGVEAVRGGKALGQDGYFVSPTILAGAADDMPVVQEEVFGPVLTVQPFDTAEEAAARANDVAYGLAAGVWTNNLRTAQRMAESLQVGTVWTNLYNYIDASVPWGGTKASGHGRDMGREGLDKFLQTKAVWNAVD